MATPSIVRRQMQAVVVDAKSPQVAIHVCGKALSIATAIADRRELSRLTGVTCRQIDILRVIADGIGPPGTYS